MHTMQSHNLQLLQPMNARHLPQPMKAVGEFFISRNAQWTSINVCTEGALSACIHFHCYYWCNKRNFRYCERILREREKKERMLSLWMNIVHRSNAGKRQHKPICQSSCRRIELYACLTVCLCGTTAGSKGRCSMCTFFSLLCVLFFFLFKFIAFFGHINTIDLKWCKQMHTEIYSNLFAAFFACFDSRKKNHSQLIVLGACVDLNKDRQLVWHISQINKLYGSTAQFYCYSLAFTVWLSS